MDRLGGAAGHAKFICPLCKMQAPSLKNMEEHHEVECSNIECDRDHDFGLIFCCHAVETRWNSI
jgi:hypothetical protein